MGSLWAQKGDYDGCYPLHKHWSFLLWAGWTAEGIFLRCYYQDDTIAWPGSAPLWLLIVGVFLGWLSVIGILWVHETLARNWSPVVESEQIRGLAKTGPYALCRHPMYFVFFLFFAGLICGTPSLILMAGAAFSTIYCLCRIPFEDRILEQAFGDEFREWKKVTPAFLPYGPCLRRQHREALTGSECPRGP